MLPDKLLTSLEKVPGFHRESFVRVHESGEQVTSIRFNPLKNNDAGYPPGAERVPWSSYGCYLPQRPFFTFDPLLHAGAYYVQEASSMFLEQALRQTADTSTTLRVLDACAAPGGKSTLIQSLISSNSLLVSNEVIKSRAVILEENITKWGGANVVVTNSDPKDMARLESFFDVIVVDAPCSGSGLFRREPEAIAEWSEGNVQLCSQRQQRILADLYPALKKNGILIYSTCSYSQEEDEAISDWLMDHFTVSSLQISINESWGIHETISRKHAAFGYRFFPDQVKGEGLFIACFRRLDGSHSAAAPSRKIKMSRLTTKEEAIVHPWLKKDVDLLLFMHNQRIMALPRALEQDMLMLMSANIYIRQAGIAIGKLAGNDLVPDHALALSTLAGEEFVAISLKKEEALQYLRKEEVSIHGLQRGWAIVRFEGRNLGCIKILPNRVNNYYPKEWRILKTGNN